MRFLLALLFAATQAGASGNCALHDRITTSLVDKYSEQVVSRGITRSAGRVSIFEFWANVQTGTWTIVQVYPDGMACQRAAGEMFENMPAPVAGDPT